MPLAFCKDQEMQTGPTRASPTGIFHIPNATEELPIGRAVRGTRLVSECKGWRGSRVWSLRHLSNESLK